MDFKDKIHAFLVSLMSDLHKYKRFVLALSCVVVFVVTYMLILPAFTLDKDEANKQGGIDISAEETAGDEDAADGSTATEEAGKDTSNNKSQDSSEPLSLTFESDDYTVAVEGKAADLTEDMSVAVEEINKEDKDQKELYESLYDDALKAVREEKGGESVSDFAFAKFYDISLMDGNDTVEPGESVDVTISYEKKIQKELAKMAGDFDPDRVRIIHFAEDKETGEVTPEVLDTDAVDVTVEDNKMTEAAFTADGFSVFAVVYTVDFSYSENGKTYEFSIPGGGFASFTKLVEFFEIAQVEYSEDSADNTENVKTAQSDQTAKTAQTLDDVKVTASTRDFVAQVESVEFSSPELLSVSKVNEDTTVGALKDSLGLECEYSDELTDEDIEKINAEPVEAGDWALISLKPFLSEETLTVTMKDGSSFDIRITDVQASDPYGLDKQVFVIENGKNWNDNVVAAETSGDSGSAGLKALNYNNNKDKCKWTFEYTGVGTEYLIHCGNQYMIIESGSGDNGTLRLVDEATAKQNPVVVQFDADKGKYSLTSKTDPKYGLNKFTNDKYGAWTYGTGNDDFWMELRNPDSYDKPGTVGTWDIKSDHIKLSLFDYSGKHNNTDIDKCWGSNKESDWTDNNHNNSGVNKGRTLVFSGSGMTASYYNTYTGGNGNDPIAMQGIVKPVIGKDNYPELTVNNSSLGYLFGAGGQEGVKGYENLQGLLRKDENGYFYYDSEQNYAYLDQNKKEVILYSQSYNKSEPSVNTSKVGFFPFNDYDASKTNVKHPDANGSDLNHQFGMTLEANFVLPPDGKLPNGQDMKFSFSGDDDVWVYIDDVLVLDLGGVHQPLGGTIDFAAKTTKDGKTYLGRSTVENATGITDGPGEGKTIGQSKTITEIFEAAGRTYDSSPNSTHTIKFYFMERGGVDSNCKLMFNLLTVDGKGDVNIVKKNAGSNKLNGAEFAVWDNEECSGEPVKTAVSGDKYIDSDGTEKRADGYLKFAKLPVNGTDQVYYLKETKAPDGYVRSNEVFRIVVDTSKAKDSKGNYTLKIQKRNGNSWADIADIEQQPTLSFLFKNDVPEKVDIPVEKVWKGGDAIKNAEINVTIGRYKLVKDESYVPPVTTGSIKINQKLTGDDTSVAPFNATYTVKDGSGNVVKQGYYMQKDQGTVIDGLEPGDYTVEIAGSAQGYIVSSTPPSQSAKVTVGETTEITFTSKLEIPSSVTTVTVNADHIMSVQDRNNGSNITHDVVNLKCNGGKVIEISFDNPSNFGGNSCDLLINGEKVKTFTGGGTHTYSYKLPEKGTVKIEVTDPWYPNGITSPIKVKETNRTSVNATRMMSRKVAGLKAASGSLTAARDEEKATKPEAPEGMKYVADDSFTENNTLTLTDAKQWKDALKDLPKTDYDGNEYYYFIQSVSETGMPEGTQVTIADELSTGGEGETLTVENQLETVDFTANKEWQDENGETITPPASSKATFHLYADGTDTGKTVVLNGKADVKTVSDPETQELNSSAIENGAYERTAWEAYWTDLPKYKSDKDGNRTEIQYAVVEDIDLDSGFRPETEVVSESGGTIINKKIVTPDPYVPTPDNTNPEIHKRIDALRDGVTNPDSPHSGEDLTDLYRLYLDYKIDSLQDPNGVDLLLVLDHSGSMNSNRFSGNKNRAKTVEKLLNGEDGLIAQFLDMNPKNRWAAVGFKGPEGLDTIFTRNTGEEDSEVLSPGGTAYTWQTKAADVKLPLERRGYIPFTWIERGETILTDYVAGLWRAEQFLKKDTDKKKVILFISDGIPTVYIDCSDDKTLANAGSKTGSEFYPDINGRGGCSDETLQQFGYFVSDLEKMGYTFGDNAELYTVGFGNSILAGTTGKNLLNGMLSSAYGKSVEHYAGLGDGNVDETAAALKAAIESMMGMEESFTNITISDDLSKYVDLVGITESGTAPADILTQAAVKITMTDPDDVSKVKVLYENGAVTEYGHGKLKEVTYDAKTKKVSAVFEKDYHAEPGIRYTLSFDVKATKAAYDEYAESGYNSTGDEDTDYYGTSPANATSVGKPGFHSNDEAKATYDHNGKPEDKTYKHPVIQASSKIRIVKEDQSGNLLEGARFELYKEGYDPSKSSQENAVYKIKETVSEKEKTDSTDALIYGGDLKPGTYYLVETEAPAGYIKLAEPVELKVTQDEETGQYTVTAKMGEVIITYPKLAQESGTSNWKLEIANTAGAELPYTGGIGTEVFYMLGAALIALMGAGLLLRRKRKTA